MSNLTLFLSVFLLLSSIWPISTQTCTSCTACCYYAFTYSWVQTTCRLEDASQSASNTKTCKPQAQLPSIITIHGLWPNLANSTSQLGYCKDQSEPFDTLRLTHLEEKLRLFWPTAFTGSGQSDESFWKHEWDKHGTCSPLGLVDYFHKSLQLDARYPINDWLTQANIVPSNSRLYSIAQIKTMFLDHSVGPDQYRIKCTSIKGGIQLLKDIMLCVSNADATTLVDCVTVKSTCTGQFYFIDNFLNELA